MILEHKGCAGGTRDLAVEMHRAWLLSCRVKATGVLSSRRPVSFSTGAQSLSESVLIRTAESLLKIPIPWQHSRKLDFIGSSGEGKAGHVTAMVTGLQEFLH